MLHAVFPFTDVGGSIRSCPSSSAIRQAVFVFTDVLVVSLGMSPSALTMRNTIANELEEPRVNYIAGISAAFVLNSLRLKPLQKTPTIELEEVVSYRHYIPLEMRREDNHVE
jgi:hypothetical protein